MDDEETTMRTEAQLRLPSLRTVTVERPRASEAAADVKMDIRGLTVRYGDFVALRDISMTIPRNSVFAIIGPSGSGKSTLLRALNRMHDSTPSARVAGDVLLDGRPIYGPNVDPIEVRRKIGMVFQRPNPFAMSIYDNVAYGLRYGVGARRYTRGELNDAVEEALTRAAIWDEVRDRLDQPAMALSGGQQQRVCIARAIAVHPEMFLRDEPASALYTIAIVTHNMQQAARVSDITAFMTMGADRAGELVEVGPTAELFTSPLDPRTEDYITGRVG